MSDQTSSKLANTEDFTTANLATRHRVGKLWRSIFFMATLIGIVALATLLFTVLNDAFGLVAIENKVDPTTLSSQPLEDISNAELIEILRANISKSRMKAVEREKPLEDMTQEELYDLVIDRVVDPRIVATWSFTESMFTRDEIEATVADKYPGAKVEFRAWLNPRFLQHTMSSRAELAGVRTAILGSLYVILVTIAFAFPVGVSAAIYLEEYASKQNVINRIIQTNIDNLAGVPSIVYGILGLAIFVRALEPFTSGQLFGILDPSGRNILAAGLTMGLLILPILIINAQEAIRSVPDSLRQASFGLGATKWQTIWNHVLPYALPGILTGTILAISRAIGETAPLIIVGASTFITADPNGIFSRFTVLPIQIYNWTTRPQDQFRNIAAAAIIVLLVMLLSLNAIAILFRNRFSKRNL